MATATITHKQGTKTTAPEISCGRAETLTVTVTTQTASGVARDCSGSEIVFSFWRRGDNGSALFEKTAGASSGAHSITVSHDITKITDGRFSYNVKRVSPNGEEETLTDVGSLVFPSSISASGYSLSGSQSTAPTVLITGPVPGSTHREGSVTYSFRASASLPLTVADFMAIIDGYPRALNLAPVTLTNGSGTTKVDGEIVVQLTNGTHELSVECSTGPSTTRATPVSVVVYGAPSVFWITPGDDSWSLAGNISVAFAANSLVAGETFGANRFALRVGGVAPTPSPTAVIDTGDGTASVTGHFVVPLAGVAAHSLTFICTDRYGTTTTSEAKVINTHLAPTATMGTPSSSTPVPGFSAFTFAATDDETLTSANCVAVVDGVETLDSVVVDSGTISIAGHYSTELATVGAHTLAIKVTDNHGVARTSTSVTVTATQPTVSLEYPVNGSSYDVQPIALGGICSPAVTGNMSFFDGETLIAAVPMVAGVAASSVAVPTIGSHSYTARVTTIAGTVPSATATVTVTDVLPVIADVSPATGATVPAGTLAVSATITHAKSRPMLARARVDSGAWFVLAFVGNVASGVSVDAYTTEVLRTLTVQATDAADWTDAAAITTSTTTFTPSYAISWNGGTLTMAAAFQAVTAPSSGDLIIDLSGAIAAAVDGAILRITVPAGPTSLGLRLGSTYVETADASIAWVDTSTFDGWSGWLPGVPYVLLVRINKTLSRFELSDRRDLAAAIPATARFWRVAGSTADVTCRDKSGATVAGKQATIQGSFALTAADPATAGTRLTSFGSVVTQLSAYADATVRCPIAGSAAGFTWMGWAREGGEESYHHLVIPVCTTSENGALQSWGASGALSAFYTANTTPSNSFPFAEIDANGYPRPGTHWGHWAIVSEGGTVRLYLMGRLIATASQSGLPATWADGVANGEGVQLGTLNGTFAGTAQYAHCCAVPEALTAEQIGAHLAATAPPSVTLPHVCMLGSSMTVTVASGTALGQSTLTAAGISSEYGHIYATHGRAVTSTTINDMTLNRQVAEATLQWGCRGGIAVLDFGNVHNQANGAQDTYDAAAVLFVEQVKRLLRAGQRVIVMDWADCQKTGVPTAGAMLRAAQSLAYDMLGASIMRFPTRQILEATGYAYTDARWYETPISGAYVHWSEAAVPVLADALAAKLIQIRNQTGPATKPSWI